MPAPNVIAHGVIHRTDDPLTFESDERAAQYIPDSFDWPVTFEVGEEVWTLEVWRLVKKEKKDGVINVRRWVSAADFERGKLLALDKAMGEMIKRQKLKGEYTYRIRNLHTGDIIPGALLS